MKKALIPLFLLCCLLCQAAAPPPAPEAAQKEAPPEPETPRLRYELTVALDDPVFPADASGDTPGLFDPAPLTVAERVTVVNDSADDWTELCFRDFMAGVWDADQKSLSFDEYDEAGNIVHSAPELEPYPGGVRSAALDGEALEIKTNGNDPSIVYIILSRPLPPGESATLELAYDTVVLPGAYRASYISTDNDRLGERTYSLAQFYPMLSVYEDGAWAADPYFLEGECMYTRCADYLVTMRLPEKYTVIASGHETKGDTADGFTDWTVEAENMRDVTVIISPDLAFLTGETQSVTVRSWYVDDGPDGGSTAQGKLSLQAALDAIDAFTDAYGPYAYDELDVVQNGYSGGMEAPGLVRISEIYRYFMLDPDPETGTGPDTCAGTVAHETAHEWFYAAVGNDQYNEAWLDEGFARYSEQVYWRHVGRSEADAAAILEAGLAKTPASGGTVDRAYDELNDGESWDYTDVVYDRAAGFLYELEKAMGREAFYDFLQEYYAAYTFREAHTEDFIALLAPHIEDNAQAQELVSAFLSRAAA